MTGVIEIRKDIALDPAVAPILYRSKTITATTLSCIDASRTWAGGGKTAGYSVGDLIKDLTYNDKSATVRGTAVYDGGGVKYTTTAPAAGSPLIDLPDTFFLASTCKKVLLNLWVKVPAVYDAQATAGPRMIIGVAKGAAATPTASSANCHVGVLYTCNSAGSLATLQLNAFGAQVSSNALSAVQAQAGKVVHLALYAYANASNKVVFRAYVNGVAFADQVTSTDWSVPTGANSRAVVGNKGVQTGFDIAYTFYRAMINDLTSSTEDVATLVANEYNAYKESFS
ncbi:hypothetical protein [Pantoea coffeiphila]|uniref:Uncharacterized protein n=1 Tax=Pantoea coffeiphila TaxID=1465635 RepID=A0A2S9I8D3_9GAMM|nr:hypothetical protein [Pantoea coffeiphila]PRD14058.1 hypothetical protein CQW29_18835 [Pantoea coffeiphila]